MRSNKPSIMDQDIITPVNLSHFRKNISEYNTIDNQISIKGKDIHSTRPDSPLTRHTPINYTPIKKLYEIYKQVEI